MALLCQLLIPKINNNSIEKPINKGIQVLLLLIFINLVKCFEIYYF